MKLSGLGRPSRRLSHFALRRVCCCGPRRQAISIDCCTARLLQARPPVNPHPQQRSTEVSSNCEPCHVYREVWKLDTELLSHRVRDMGYGLVLKVRIVVKS